MSTYGISGRLVNLDNYYSELCLESTINNIKKPTVINDIVVGKDTLSVSNEINNLLQNRIIDEQLNNTPICDVNCEHPIGYRYNLGVVCPTCGNRVVENRLESEVWLRAPSELRYFINPRFWMLFNDTFGGLQLKNFDRKNYVLDRGADLMLWMLDPYYILPKNPPKKNTFTTDILLANGYTRGSNNFIDNYKRIFGILTEYKNFHKIMSCTSENSSLIENRRQKWIKLIETQGDAIFTRHLPLITSKIIVVEETKRGISVDPVYVGLIDAVKTVADIYTTTKTKMLDDRRIISRALKANRQFAYFYNDFRKSMLNQKTGYYRSKVSSTFIPWSGRATITPIAGPHKTEELYAPWRWFISLFAVDIENKLMRRGFTARECEKMIAFACMQYDSLIDEIINELLVESKDEYGEGIYTVMLRNPTLVQLGIQTFRITKVIKDVNICSIFISNRAIKGSNAD